MSLLNLNAIESQPLESQPFDYLVVPGVLDTSALSRVNADYPAISTAANHTMDNLKFGETFAQLLAELQDKPFATSIGKKFKMELESLPTTITVRKYCERSDGNIHTDHKSKVLTVLIYFNEDWPHCEGKLRLLRGNSDIEDYAAEVEPLGGTLLAFRRTDHSWHGHTQFVGERKMLQLNYLEQNAWSVWSQQVSRFGTHFMKNVLGMR